MKTIFKTLIILSLFFISSCRAQIKSVTSTADGKYQLKSTSFDSYSYNYKGKSKVVQSVYNYKKSKSEDSIIYTINRSFNIGTVPGGLQFIAFSKDGKKIAYFSQYPSGEKEDKHVNYYVDGKFIKGYSAEEFSNCNRNQEKCELFYDNRLTIYERINSSLKVYKKGTDDKEKYLRQNFIFNKDDTIYVVDARKKITLFDLNNNKIIKTKIDFDSIYPKIKDFERVDGYAQHFEGAYKQINDFENSINNEKLSTTISNFTKLKFIGINDPYVYKYKLYKIELSGYLDHEGKFEIEKFECDDIFNKKQIEDYIRNTNFKADFVPNETEKYYFPYFVGGYRSYDEKVAERETLKEKEKQKEEFAKRLTLEKIDNIYIPKNLYECMTELDKTLNFEMKQKLKASTDSFSFNDHGGGLGMWIRNNWGINGGSRLLKYFNDRGNIGNREYGHDIISSIIINSYIKWINGDKNIWKEWEKSNPKKR